MTPEQFTYWLQGSVELSGGERPTAEQWDMIRAHLSTVFTKITPPLHPVGITNTDVGPTSYCTDTPAWDAFRKLPTRNGGGRLC